MGHALFSGEYVGSFVVGENNIVYGQDHRQLTGIPVGRWDVFSLIGLWKLVAPGYGEVSDYGNGALYVSKERYGLTLPSEFSADV